MGLFDMVMIKDNHVSIAGGVKNALRSVDLYLDENNLHMGVEVVFSIFKVLPGFLVLNNKYSSLLTCQLDNQVLPKYFIVLSSYLVLLSI